jgi:hypothetical protein
MIKWQIVTLFIVASALLASGILLVLVACIQYGNWWPLTTILIQFFAVAIPISCTWDNDSMDRDPKLAGWIACGFLVVAGYGIPGVLLRGGAIPAPGLLIAYAGSTCILTGILIFVRFIKNH